MNRPIDYRWIVLAVLVGAAIWTVLVIIATIAST